MTVINSAQIVHSVLFPLKIVQRFLTSCFVQMFQKGDGFYNSCPSYTRARLATLASHDKR